MKKIALVAVLGMSLLSGFRSNARVNINVSFGLPVMQQSWYANDNDYVYMPDQGVYFNIRRQMYVFQDGGRWNTAQRLPARFGNISYANVRTVRMNDRMPFEQDMDNRRRFAANNDRGFGNDDRRNANYAQQGDRRQNGGRFENGGFRNDRNAQNNNFGNGRR